MEYGYQLQISCSHKNKVSGGSYRLHQCISKFKTKFKHYMGACCAELTVSNVRYFVGGLCKLPLEKILLRTLSNFFIVPV